MDLITWLKLFHILGAIVWVGGGVLLSMIGIRTRQSDDPHIIREFARTLSYVGIRVFMPAVLAVVVFGVWMVLATPAWNFGQLWILLALGAFVLAFLIGGIYLSRVAIGLERITKPADFDIHAARALLSRWINAYLVVLVILLIAVWDMVFKPFM